jgi:predicted transcriptional regulator
MKVLSPEEIQKRLREMPYAGLTKVAEALGISKQAVSQMKLNPNINPTWSTLVKFSEYLEGCDERKN